MRVCTAQGLPLALAQCPLWPCHRGCPWALPPTQQLHTGSIEADTFLPACVTGGEGASPAPTDPEGQAAPGGGAGLFPAHLEVMTPVLLPGGATDVSSQAWPRTGGGVQRPERRRPRGMGIPRREGAPHTASRRGGCQRCLKGVGGRGIHLPAHRQSQAVYSNERVGRRPEAGDWMC